MEAGLVTRVRRGDEDAFHELYQIHRRSIFQFAWRLTGSQTAAEDVAQECFLSLLEGSGFDAGRGALRTYLLGMARHLSGCASRCGRWRRPRISPVLWTRWGIC